MSRLPVLLSLIWPLCSQAQIAPESKRPVDAAELVSAGKKDSVKSIDHPKFVSAAEAAPWLNPKEPVIVVELNGEARAYPVQILIWHLLVNDQLGETPILVSYSVFCHSAAVFDRRAGDAVREFGFAGVVRNSDLVMFDRQSGSLWQQLTGEAISGSLTGAKLAELHSEVAPFDAFRQSYPNGKVMSRDTGYTRNYGQNPYSKYLIDGRLRFPVKLPSPMPVPPMEELVAVWAGGFVRAYPLSALGQRRVLEDKIDGQRFVILSDNSMLNARDTSVIADSGADISAGVFSPVLDGKTLSFRYHGGAFLDRRTGSAWNVLGTSIKGPLSGKRLRPMASAQAFAFAWLVFHPNTLLIREPGPIVPDMVDPLDQNPDSRPRRP